MSSSAYNKYTKLHSLYSKAYPDKSRNKVNEDCSKLWKEVKDAPMKYAKQIASLETRIAQKREKKLKFWSGLKTKVKAGECLVNLKTV